jgi:hypothetical protein
VARPSLPLCDAVRHGQQQPRGTATHSYTAGVPHPRKRTAEPSKGRRTTTPRPCKDNAVMSGRRDRSPPSPSALCDHPRRPRRYPRRRGSVRRRETTTPAVVPPYSLASTTPSSPHTGGPRTGDLYTATLEAVPGAHWTRHDALLEERFTRTTVYSATLYTMPLHVGEIVRHACKLSPPLAYKRRGSPLAAGEDGERSLARFPP